MGQIFYKITVDQIEKTIEALTGAISGMTEAMQKMQDAGMGEAYFPWTERQWQAQDVIVTLGDECKTKIQSQVNAFRQGRPSEYERIKARSKRIVAARNAKQTEPAVKKPRGRPRKGTA